MGGCQPPHLAYPIEVEVEATPGVRSTDVAGVEGVVDAGDAVARSVDAVATVSGEVEAVARSGFIGVARSAGVDVKSFT